MNTSAETTYAELARTLAASSAVIEKKVCSFGFIHGELPSSARDTRDYLVRELREQAQAFRDSCPPGAYYLPDRSDLRRFRDLEKSAREFLRNLERLDRALDAF